MLQYKKGKSMTSKNVRIGLKSLLSKLKCKWNNEADDSRIRSSLNSFISLYHSYMPYPCMSDGSMCRYSFKTRSYCWSNGIAVLTMHHLLALKKVENLWSTREGTVWRSVSSDVNWTVADGLPVRSSSR